MASYNSPELVGLCKSGENYLFDEHRDSVERSADETEEQQRCIDAVDADVPICTTDNVAQPRATSNEFSDDGADYAESRAYAKRCKYVGRSKRQMAAAESLPSA